MFYKAPWASRALGADGQPDGYDTDLDGMDDGWEVTYALNANLPSHIEGTDIQITGNTVSSTNTDLSFFGPGDWFTVEVEGDPGNDGLYIVES